MAISPGLAAFKLATQLSPIILTGGIAAGISVLGGQLPIIVITQALDFVDGLLSGADIDFDDFFANFTPLPGSTLIEQTIGKYPFANQAVAANAVIAQPLTISMRMICPARDEAGYAIKFATMTALKFALSAHNASGGTYTVVTPSYIYTNCLMTSMKDTSNTSSAQAQNTYQLDFEQPLLTLISAIQAQGNLMSQITAGTPISGTPSWSNVTAGPTSLAGIGQVPALTNTAGAQTIAPSLPSGSPL